MIRQTLVEGGSFSRRSPHPHGTVQSESEVRGDRRGRGGKMQSRWKSFRMCAPRLLSASPPSELEGISYAQSGGGDAITVSESPPLSSSQD